MSLFFDLLSSINNPNQQGSVDQLETLTNTIQQTAAERGIPASQLQTVMSALGSVVRPALQQQSQLPGGGQLNSLLNQFMGPGTSASALQSLFPPQMQQQMIQGVSQKTGMSPTLLQNMLPSLIPAVMGLLNMGASKPGTIGGNAVLNSFLSGDANADLGDVLKFSNRFLNPPQV